MSDDQPETPAPDDSAPKPPKKKRVTRRQEKIARARVSDPNATQQEISDKTRTTRPHVAVVLKMAHVQDRIRALMEAHPDTTLEGLTNTLRQGLKATKVKVFHSDLDGISYAAPLVDHPTRHRFLETGLELHGVMEKRIRIAGDEEAPLPLIKALEILRAAQALGLTDGDLA